MAQQTVPHHGSGGSKTTAAQAFADQTVVEYFKTLVRDLITQRNAVDAAVTAFNLLVTAANGIATKYNALATKFNTAMGKYNALATLWNAAVIGKLYFYENIAAKSATAIHAAFAGNTDHVKAELDLDTPSATLDTVVEATTAGVAGNAITIAGAANSAPAGGVTISRTGTAFIIHWESGVSTVADVETAITALAGGDDLFGVKTGGTGATVLGANDEFEATALAGGINGNAFPGAFTNPAYPRNLSCVAAAGYDGGAVTITGTDPADAALEETITPTPGGTEYGVKLFKTVTSALKAAVGVDAAAVSIGTGDKLWVGADVASAFGMLAVAGTHEAVTVDATYDAFTPTSAPDGTKDFTLLVNVNTGNADTDAAEDGDTGATTTTAAGVAPANVVAGA